MACNVNTMCDLEKSECEFVELPDKEAEKDKKCCDERWQFIEFLVINFIAGLIVGLWTSWYLTRPHLVGIFDTCQFTSINTEMVNDSSTFIVDYPNPEDLYATGGSGVFVDYLDGVFTIWTELPCVSVKLYDL